jgi:hypothetical protein
MEDRHNNQSTIFGLQLPVGAWYEVSEGFIAYPLLDHFVHGAHRISLSCESLTKIKKVIIAGQQSSI